MLFLFVMVVIFFYIDVVFVSLCVVMCFFLIVVF